jgi:hypothetical protein
MIQGEILLLLAAVDPPTTASIKTSQHIDSLEADLQTYILRRQYARRDICLVIITELDWCVRLSTLLWLYRSPLLCWLGT